MKPEENGRLILEMTQSIARKLILLEKSEALQTTLASEKTLAKDWSAKEDERWNRFCWNKSLTSYD